MGRRKLQDEKVLRHVQARIPVARYEQLKNMLGDAPNRDMSSLIRDILENKPVKVITYDKSLDKLMHELAAHRAEIKAIGVNINQITRFFNTYPEEHQKAFYAKMAFEQYKALQLPIEKILSIITSLSEKWLSE